MSTPPGKDWRDQLSPEVYRITRECGTEPPFSGKYYAHKGNGDYVCVCCGATLFRSASKYDSGSGWPSFMTAEPGAVRRLADNSHGMRRTEIRCAACDAHLGHVFPDGPQPSGERFCVNSLSLDFRDAD